MDLVSFITILAIIITFFFIFFVPTSVDDEQLDDEHYHQNNDELTIKSLKALLENAISPRVDIQIKYTNKILSMGPKILPLLTEIFYQELLTNELFATTPKIEKLKEIFSGFGLNSVPFLLDLLENNPSFGYDIPPIFETIGPSTLPIIISRITLSTLINLSSLFSLWQEETLEEALKQFHNNPNHSNRDTLKDLISAYSENCLTPLVRSFSESTGLAREETFDILVSLAPPEEKELFIQALSDPSPIIRQNAIKALTTICSPDLLSHILSLLRDPDFNVRRAALTFFASCHHPKAIPFLTERKKELERDPSTAQEQLLVAIALASLGESIDKNFLQKNVTSPHPTLRTLALQLARHLPTTEQLSLLKKLLWQRNFILATSIIKELSLIPHPASARVLLDYVNDTSEDDPLLPLCKKALVQLKEHATPILLQKLHSDNPFLTKFSLNVLLISADTKAIPGVLEFLRDSKDLYREWGIQGIELNIFFSSFFPSREPQYRQFLQTFIKKYPKSAVSPIIRDILKNR